MTNILASKTALITGAAGGFGKAIARAFLDAGAQVVITDVNEGILQLTHQELSSLGPLHVIAGDLTDREMADRLIQTARDQYGKLDILVNNAGIMDRFDPIGELDMAFWDRVLAVNLTGPARVTQASVQEFLRDDRPTAKGGAILTVGSINGLRGGIAGAAYTTTKHALVGLTRSTAAHYATKGIRSNIIMPGLMETNIRTAYENGVNEEGRALAWKSLGVNPGHVNIDDLSKLVVFACSDQATYLNGAIISTDHGWQAI
ncbi:hypothetical protein FE257_013007 [Aspergillus nanangensis]|uniref:Uncharacterized protein n=1 Tax=Aspergillus nanangensis TaxID=2582783 RepID=A0AAD4GPL9_ASPNN|nr:hypothetical protein FE257_013007 [Aspergillus nanangensis]